MSLLGLCASLPFASTNSSHFLSLYFLVLQMVPEHWHGIVFGHQWTSRASTGSGAGHRGGYDRRRWHIQMFGIECRRRGQHRVAADNHGAIASGHCAECVERAHGRNGRIPMCNHQQWHVDRFATHYMVQRWQTIAAIGTTWRHTAHLERQSRGQRNVPMRGATPRKRYVSSIGRTAIGR